jgi:hypothetical protein
MGRERKRLERVSQVRDARLFVIATEGEETEKQYFEDLMSKDWYSNPRVIIEVLERSSSASNPKRILKLLDERAKKTGLKFDDELWLVIDRDKQSWTIEEIAQVAQVCLQKGYYLAISNPCFELWLLLHIQSLDEYSDETLQEFLDNKKVSSSRTRLEKELILLLGSYNKSNLDTSQFLPYVKEAIERAKKLDIFSEQRWQNQLGTRIYKLVEKIIGN